MAILTQENAPMTEYTPEQAEEDTLSTIKVWVWSGFYSEADAAEMLEDHLSEEDAVPDPNAVRKALAVEFKAKAVAEKSWPKETDCDRLDRVFEALEAAGIVALQNAGYTMSEGRSDVGEALHERGFDKYHGYCFYHGQDLERAVNGGGLMLAFADLNDNTANKTAVGQQIVAILNKSGFATDWNGDPERRIDIPKIDWKRRTPK